MQMHGQGALWRVDAAGSTTHKTKNDSTRSLIGQVPLFNPRKFSGPPHRPWSAADFDPASCLLILTRYYLWYPTPAWLWPDFCLRNLALRCLLLQSGDSCPWGPDLSPAGTSRQDRLGPNPSTALILYGCSYTQANSWGQKTGSIMDMPRDLPQ